MTPWLATLLCDPHTRESLTLENAHHDSRGDIESGTLRSPGGRTYPITNGIPRFVEPSTQATVHSFGDQWNHFNFVEFKLHWQNHTVANTFGSTEAFRDKLIVDAGGGSGAQTLWMLESGAKHVIMLELSHSVDDVVQRNLRPSGYHNFDVIQCSIDAPPLRSRSIEGIVICHNVIQHTLSVERTAHALFDLVAEGGEFVFNCYSLNDVSPLRWIRFHVVLQPLRALLSRMPFAITLTYAQTMALLRLVPGVGDMLEKSGVCVQGDVPRIPGESPLERLWRRRRATALNTFDSFGSHAYQHYKPDDEIRALVSSLQPNPDMVRNSDRYFSRPGPIGCALRVRR
jgi:uncharacterized protein YbaR (Trm112 family)